MYCVEVKCKSILEAAVFELTFAWHASCLTGVEPSSPIFSCRDRQHFVVEWITKLMFSYDAEIVDGSY